VPNDNTDLSTFDSDELAPMLRGILRGIEKESLRIDRSGLLAPTRHPAALGSALTHPLITTDYSEALIELITPTSTGIEATLTLLDEIHRCVYGALDQELLWCASMPCVLADDTQIPVAEYGNSNIGRLKHLYRIGLGHRYGRAMQTIAGIHYNFSLPDSLWQALQARQGDRRSLTDYKTDRYFALIRNFRRHFWLLIYLFGAAPALCRSLVANRPHQLESFDDGSLYLPYATSLRMGSVGYQSDAQSSLTITHNDLDNYIDTLYGAMTTPYPAYQKIGVKVDGEYRQINANLLQIENEYYSPIRPKRVANSGEKPLHALHQRGVEYVEVRCLDLNPYLPLGIDAEQIRLLDIFLLNAALDDSPPISRDECHAIQHNQKTVVNEGRRPGVTLLRAGSPVRLTDWGHALMEQMAPAAEQLDQSWGGDSYRQTLTRLTARLHDADLTPAARILAEMRDQRLSFSQFAMQHSLAHERHFRSRPLPPDRHAHFAELAEASWHAQQQIEASDQLDFDSFLQAYQQQPIRDETRA